MQTENQVSKGPLIGIIIALIGIVLIISSFFGKETPEKGIEATIKYAGKAKLNSSDNIKYQNLTIVYSYEGKDYKANVKFKENNYKQGQKIEIKVNPNNIESPTLIETKEESSSGLFFGFILLILGGLLFLNIINFDKIN